MGKAPRGFFVDGFSTRVAREGKAVFAMSGKAFPQCLPSPAPRGIRPRRFPPSPLPRPPRRPETLEEIQDDRFGRRDSPSEGAEGGFLPGSPGGFRQKAHSVLDALLTDMPECARRERGMAEEGPGRESRAFSMRGEARVARISRSLLPDIMKHSCFLTRPASPGEFLHPLHPRRKSSRISCGSRAPSRHACACLCLTRRLKAPLGAILRSDGNFPILPPSRRPAAPLCSSWGHPRPFPLRMRDSRGARPAIPPPLSPMPSAAYAGGKGQRKMEGVCMPTPRMRGTRRARGGLRSPPFLPFPCPESLARMPPRIMRPRARVARALSVLRILEKENAEIYK